MLDKPMDGGVEGRFESWGGRKREKGGAGTDGSIDGGRDGVAILANIDRDCNLALHSKRTDVSQANGSAKRRSESLDGLKGESGNESTFGGRDQERGNSTSKNVYYIKCYYNKICI